MGNANITPPNRKTEWQNSLSAIGRTVASIPSLIGAAYIVQHVIRSPKRRKRTSTRVLLGMSSMDFILSITHAASTFIAPRGSKIYAVGTWTTCEVFGFLGQGSRLSSVIYNGSLTVYYLLTIHYGVTERQMGSIRIEPWLHLVPLVIGWSTAIACLPLTLYNPLPAGCEIGSRPFGCPDTKPCVRGNNADLYRMAFVIFPVWIVFVFLVIAMGMIYHHISKFEKASDHFRRPESRFGVITDDKRNDDLGTTTQEQSSKVPIRRSTKLTFSVSFSSFRRKEDTSTGIINKQKHARKFAVQALLYCLAYAITWLFFTIGTVLRLWINGQTYYPIAFLNYLLSSLQGFWNALIYIRPRYLRYRKLQRRQQHQANNNREQQQSTNDSVARVLHLFSQAAIQAVVVDAEDDEDLINTSEDDDDGVGVVEGADDVGDAEDALAS